MLYNTTMNMGEILNELFFFKDGDFGSLIPSKDGFFNFMFFNLPNKFENFSFVEDGLLLFSSLTLLLFKIFFSRVSLIDKTDKFFKTFQLSIVSLLRLFSFLLISFDFLLNSSYFI